MRMSSFFIQLGRIVVGYVAAALAFGIAVVMGLISSVTTPNSEAVTVFTSIFGLGAFFSAFFSIPFVATMLLLILLTEWTSLRHWGVYLGVGLAGGAAMLMPLLMQTATNRPEEWSAFGLLVLGSVASGLTYWAIAGRHAGSWRA